MDEKRTALAPARLGRALKYGFRAAYDSLGYVVFATFASLICTSAFLGLGALILRAMPPRIWNIVLFIPAVAIAYMSAVGVFYYTSKVVAHEHPVVADTFRGIKMLWRPALGLFAIDSLISIVLFGDLAFFVYIFGAKHQTAFAVLAIIAGYMSLMWLLMMMYHLPLLMAQLGMESGPKTRVVLKKSFLLAADNPGFTVGLFVVIIAFAALCAIPALIGMAILFLGGAAFLLNSALRELFIKYGITEDEPEVVDERPWSLPESWRKRQDSEDSEIDKVGGGRNG